MGCKRRILGQSQVQARLQKQHAEDIQQVSSSGCSLHYCARTVPSVQPNTIAVKSEIMGCHRNNTFSSIRYMDDWAIFGYDLFNEPRCPASQMTAPCTQRITDWANTMYAFAKSHNKKQLVGLPSVDTWQRVKVLGAIHRCLLHIEHCNSDNAVALLQFTFGEEGFFAENPAPASANWWQRVMSSW
jgi:hypothetical protein